MFPINLPVVLHAGDIDYTKVNVERVAVLPLWGHPGSFGYKRKHHRHEGVDIYCPDRSFVYAIESGVVIGIQQFTGEGVGSGWWNDTWSVMVEGKSGVINYGEIVSFGGLIPGTRVAEGDFIGHVTPVLKVDKGRPMSMLHVELYKHGVLQPIKEWPLDSPKPEHLLNPTTLLVNHMLGK